MRSLNKTTKSFNSFYVVLLLLAIFGLYIVYSICYVNPALDKKYLSEYEIVAGRFYEFGEFRLGKNTQTKVIYNVNGKDYYYKLHYDAPCRASVLKTKETRAEIVDFRFPVAVSALTPEYALPLIRPEDFKKIKKPFPDSLKLMYDRYFDCTLWEEFVSKD